jgi:SSS family solute:Na+ symporter
MSFLLVAFYTFFSGIKAPTYTAIIKDILVWVIMLYMVVSIPIIHFGSWGHMMQTTVHKAPQMLTLPTSGPKGMLWFSTAALISALALFMWPHTATGIFSSKSGESLRKNAIVLPFYNIVLMLVTFLGITAFLVVPKGTDPRFAFLELIHMSYGGTVQGLAYSTIALASLVPCSIMAIGASSLFANNIYRDVINPKASGTRMTMVTRYMVFVVIGLALLFGLLFPTALISLQLMGVSGIVQIFPAIVFSLYWRNLSREAALSGFVAGMVVVAAQYIFHTSFGAYEGFWGLCVNILVLVILNPMFVNRAKERNNAVMETLFGKKGSTGTERKAV